MEVEAALERMAARVAQQNDPAYRPMATRRNESLAYQAARRPALRRGRAAERLHRAAAPPLPSQGEGRRSDPRRVVLRQTRSPITLKGRWPPIQSGRLKQQLQGVQLNGRSWRRRDRLRRAVARGGDSTEKRLRHRGLASAAAWPPQQAPPGRLQTASGAALLARAGGACASSSATPRESHM
jgi:hypothetical protein